MGLMFSPVLAGDVGEDGLHPLVPKVFDVDKATRGMAAAKLVGDARDPADDGAGRSLTSGGWA
jgi:hypothetical protein